MNRLGQEAKNLSNYKMQKMHTLVKDFDGRNLCEKVLDAYFPICPTSVPATKNPAFVKITVWYEDVLQSII